MDSGRGEFGVIRHPGCCLGILCNQIVPITGSKVLCGDGHAHRARHTRFSSDEAEFRELHDHVMDRRRRDSEEHSHVRFGRPPAVQLPVKVNEREILALPGCACHVGACHLDRGQKSHLMNIKKLVGNRVWFGRARDFHVEARRLRMHIVAAIVGFAIVALILVEVCEGLVLPRRGPASVSLCACITKSRGGCGPR